MKDDGQEHLTATQARSAVTPHVTRYVLGVGLALVIVLFILIWAIAR